MGRREASAGRATREGRRLLARLAPDTERRAVGKALRERLPRRDQGEWEPSRRRGDLVGALLRSVKGRRADLLPIRWARMATTPFHFFRGAAAIMAADIGPGRTAGMKVLACGDAHLLNLGAYAAPDGHLVFDLNDFDEACRGPFEWDLKRLAASLIVGGRVAGHREGTCEGAVRSFTAAYREHLEHFSRMAVLELARQEIARGSTGRPLAPIFTRATRDTPQQLLRKATLPAQGGFARFRDRPPLQRHLRPAEARVVLGGIPDYRATLGPGRRQVLDAYAPRDLAFRVVGTGSIGLDNYVILLYGNGHDDPLFLQVKEERPTCWGPYLGRERDDPGAYRHQGRRAAEVQLRTQTLADPFLGWTRLGGKDFLVRQWSDHKAAIHVELLERRDVLEDYATLCGEVLAKAHVRTGDGAMLAGYCGTGESLDLALVRFARAYADQTERDHELFCQAIQQGRLPAARGT